MSATATVTSKGQVTVPKEVREALHLAPGTRLVFEPRGEEGFLIRPARGASLASIVGRLHVPGVVVSVEEMSDAIGEGASEEGSRDSA